MKSMSNKKKRLLITLATVCVGWGEGADFEFKEVIIDGGYYNDVVSVYGVEYPNSENFPDEDDDPKFKEALDKWNKILLKIQSEILEFLAAIRNNYK